MQFEKGQGAEHQHTKERYIIKRIQILHRLLPSRKILRGGDDRSKPKHDEDETNRHARSHLAAEQPCLLRRF